MTPPLGILLMAYGSPASLDDVEAYFVHIRGGRKPSPEAVEELRERYRRIGGRSPLLEITLRQAQGVQAKFAHLGLPVRVYVGMKHAPPFIADSVAEMARDGVRTAIGLTLTPQYSRMSVGAYVSTAREAAGRHEIALRCVESWHNHPGFVQALVARVREAQRQQHGSQPAPVIFTAHSLPVRILEWHDPYPDQLRETCDAVATMAGVRRWLFAYQSASRTGEPWLGPNLSEVLEHLRGEEHHEVIVCPVGFVSDHLEVLHDIDIEGQEEAKTLGLRLVRAPSLNDTRDFVNVLVDVLRAHAPEIAPSGIQSATVKGGAGNVGRPGS